MTKKKPGTSRTIGQEKQAAQRCGLPLDEWRLRRAAGLVRCYRCKEWMPVASFARDASRKDGHASICRPCNSRRSLRSKYGLTEQQMAELTDDPGRCPICEREGQPMRIDHDHATGKIRGLICNRCNVGLGQFEDDRVLLARASAYLERHT